MPGVSTANRGGRRRQRIDLIASEGWTHAVSCTPGRPTTLHRIGCTVVQRMLGARDPNLVQATPTVFRRAQHAFGEERFRTCPTCHPLHT